MPSQFLHVLWAPGVGPLAAYWDPRLARMHARAMTGVSIGVVLVSETLPNIVREDMASELDGDDDTPSAMAIPIEEIDD